ncbi:hypothetical protein [Phytoactinopolyspora limicola]|uniref:hypothetical protein n=1 Tax=Phytoactinopolyspora limicola TaxID=2715536 RepID=UPI0014098D27|nr:hypothetical protein [Phytoactinopolyspora limicola]
MAGEVIHPAPDRAARATQRAWGVTIATGVMVGVLAAGVLIAAGNDGSTTTSETAPAMEGAVAADHMGLLEPGMVEALFGELEARGVTRYHAVSIRPDWATFEVEVAPGAIQYDTITYRDGGFGEREPAGEIDTDPDATYFEASALAPGVVGAAAARAAEVAGLPDRPVSYIRIDRQGWWRGILTVSVQLESDSYGSAAHVVWDGSGRHLLRDGS